MTTYTGTISGTTSSTPVALTRRLHIWDSLYSQETYELIQATLLLVPEDVNYMQFLKGVMTVMLGNVNPQIVKEVWDGSSDFCKTTKNK